MTDTTTETEIETETETETLGAAREAVDCALPFAELLARQFIEIADELRRGDDAPALLRIGASADELHNFLHYLILVGEVIETCDEVLGARIAAYRRELTRILETLGPALADLDLVEVADTLELDVVRSIEAYGELHAPLCETLAAA